jgi:cytochrome c
LPEPVYPKIPEGEDGQGGYLLRASYTDKGTQDISSLTDMDYIALRNPYLDPQKSEVRKGVQLMTTPRVNFFMTGDQSHIGFNSIDLTGVEQINLFVDISPRADAIGGYVEVRLGSPTGELIGQTQKMEPKNLGFMRPPAGVNPLEWRRQNTPQAEAKIREVTGFHDVYFVFKNPDAKETDILMSISEIQFSNQASSEND